MTMELLKPMDPAVAADRGVSRVGAAPRIGSGSIG